MPDDELWGRCPDMKLGDAPVLFVVSDQSTLDGADGTKIALPPLYSGCPAGKAHSIYAIELG